MQMNNDVASICFSTCSEFLYSHGGNISMLHVCIVYNLFEIQPKVEFTFGTCPVAGVWRSFSTKVAFRALVWPRRLINSWFAGTYIIRVLCTWTKLWFCRRKIRSSTGIVNLYSESAIIAENGDPKPAKVIKNLLTPVDNLTFSSNGEILALSSQSSANAMRMVRKTIFAVVRSIILIFTVSHGVKNDLSKFPTCNAEADVVLVSGVFAQQRLLLLRHQARLGLPVSPQPLRCILKIVWFRNGMLFLVDFQKIQRSWLLFEKLIKTGFCQPMTIYHLILVIFIVL